MCAPQSKLLTSGKFWIPVLAITTVAFMISTIVLAAAGNGSGSDSGVKAASMGSLGAVNTARPPEGDNPCHDTKPEDEIFYNKKCVVNGLVAALEQAGGNVTIGYKGDLNTTGREPITTPYFEAGLCPVNVHWHLGTEHLSVGEYDDNGKGPSNIHHRRRLAGKTRLGHQCSLYDKDDSRFTTEYEWKHCTDMEVGQTYEVHWPHSAAGACGTINQYQTPFYDGVFCTPGIISLDPLNTFQKIGVQAQVFTIINDDSYYYPDLMRGMIVDGEMGSEITKYTGSTTGTSRDNNMCSSWTPITWQVDRKCHLISASSFDKMCADMKAQRDDMTDDLYPHGSRKVVSDHLAADNHQNIRSRE
mmetsp:Transcript_21979/g.33238  ORF Transcript_21979/g.33238 Transcript_21979/m.33238 type:complete len:359 (+) Transcript_21979:175-1251(+)